MATQRNSVVLAVATIASPALAQLPAGWTDEASCVTCHAEISASYQDSAHARTSAWPSESTVKGNFSPGANAFLTSNPNVSFFMETIGGKFFQKATVVTPTQILKRSERIDLVIGSGRKGQTFLYWDRDQLFELPISYWTKTSEWTNSPGYPDGTAHFDRGASERCLECHTSSFVARPPTRNRFDPSSVLPGISCQKCHGPAATHVSEKLKPSATSAQRSAASVVNPSKLARERQMDLCALCHAGVGRALAPPLSYSVGDALANVLVVASVAPGQSIDPHGSQLQTLARSACYQQSPSLTCITCHNVHRTQSRTDEQAATCISCHGSNVCRASEQHPNPRAGCIDCHMPLETTAKIIMRTASGRHQPEVRNHRIGIYPVGPASP